VSFVKGESLDDEQNRSCVSLLRSKTQTTQVKRTNIRLAVENADDAGKVDKHTTAGFGAIAHSSNRYDTR
jgi:hypothetical protein